MGMNTSSVQSRAPTLYLRMYPVYLLFTIFAPRMAGLSGFFPRGVHVHAEHAPACTFPLCRRSLPIFAIILSQQLAVSLRYTPEELGSPKCRTWTMTVRITPTRALVINQDRAASSRPAWYLDPSMILHEGNGQGCALDPVLPAGSMPDFSIHAFD